MVALRRERRHEYLRYKLPDAWTGQPEPIPITAAEPAGTGAELTGLAVSPGVAEGRARVVRDPLADPLEPGEILVCGRRGQGQRLETLAPPPGVHPPRPLGVDVAGGRLGPAMQQAAMPNGRISNRIMIQFKLPF